jgi:hypothetical protein
MSTTVWEVPVATDEERMLGMSRLLLRSVPAALPREARPSRARHERLPQYLRVWGAASRKIGSD